MPPAPSFGDEGHGARLHRHRLGADRHEHVDARVPGGAAVVVAVRGAQHRALERARNRAGDDLARAGRSPVPAARRARRVRPRAAPSGSHRRRRRSRSRWRAGSAGRSTSCRRLGLLLLHRRQLGVERVAERLLLLLLLLEIRLLALEQVVHRRELLHDVVVGLVGLVEQLLAPDRVDRVGRVGDLLELVARVRVREDRPLPGDVPELVGVRLRRRDRVLELRDVACVASSLWSAAVNAAAVSSPLLAGVVELLARGGEVVAGRGRAGREGGTTRCTAKAMRTRRTRRSRVIETGVGRPGIRER